MKGSRSAAIVARSARALSRAHRPNTTHAPSHAHASAPMGDNDGSMGSSSSALQLGGLPPMSSFATRTSSLPSSSHGDVPGWTELSQLEESRSTLDRSTADEVGLSASINPRTVNKS